MIRTRTLAALVALAATLAACTAPDGRPAATVTGVSPTAVTATGDITVDGADFFGIVGGQGVEIEVCGVRVPAEVVDGVLRSVVLPPAGRVRIEEGAQVTATLPAEGLVSGPSDLRVLLPDGSVATYPDAVTCSDGSFRVRLDVEQTIDGFGGAPRTVTYDASASTGEGELTFTWGPAGEILMPAVPGSIDGPVLTTPHLPGNLQAHRLTVTDEAGQSDERTVLTVIDAAETQGESDGGPVVGLRAIEPADVLPTLDVTRMTWYQDVDDAVIEVETLGPHALIAPGTPLPCEPVDERPTLALEAGPTLNGQVVLLPEPDAEEGETGFGSAFIVALAARSDDGRFPIYGSSDGPCGESGEPTPPLGHATVSTDGSVTTLRAPQAVVGDGPFLALGIFGGSLDEMPTDFVFPSYGTVTEEPIQLESFGIR